MFKGNYSCNRAVIFELVFFCCYRYFEPTTKQQPLSPQTPKRQPPTTFTAKRQPRHHYDNHQPPSPQCQNANITSPPSPNRQPPSPQNASHSITPTTNHLLHHANHHSPSPQPHYNPLRIKNHLCHGEKEGVPITPGISPSPLPCFPALRLGGGAVRARGQG